MNLKFYLTSTLVIFFIGNLYSQSNPFSASIPKTPEGLHRCYTDQIAHDQFDNDVTFRKAILDDMAGKYRGNSNLRVANNLFPDSVVRIPVVFHVIYNSTASNISKAQIESQVRILNEDYRKIANTNGDGNGVDTRFEFFLAEVDDNGDCTDGIVRIQNAASNHNSQNPMALKGLSQWDPTRYLNIWVPNNIVGGVLGYATLPFSLAGNPFADGVVVADHYIGDMGTSGSGSYGFGRTLTHEVGHWLGLYHPFQGQCSGMTDNTCATQGDEVCDTPPVQTPNFTCNLNRNSCTENITILGGNSRDLVENYMDYTNDLCMDMFTAQQDKRMDDLTAIFRANLLDSMNAINAGYYGCELSLSASLLGNDTVCIGETANISFSLTGIPPFDVVYTDGTNNDTLFGMPNNFNLPITAVSGVTNYQIVSVSSTDTLLVAPDPLISGSIQISAFNSGGGLATLSGGASICDGDSATLTFNINGGTGPFSISLNNGVGSVSGLNDGDLISILPVDSIPYTILDISDVNGCDADSVIDGVSFNINPLPVSFFLANVNKNVLDFTNSSTGASSYSWDFGDGNGSTQTDPSHVYASTGLYTVTLTSTSDSNCTSSYSEDFDITELSSLNSLKAGESFEIHPVPAINSLQLKFNSQSINQLEWNLIDLNGKQIQGGFSINNTGVHNERIDISDLPSGIFLLKLALEDGRIFNKRIFKQ